MKAKVLILNGPNLNMLGTRETGIYPAVTLEKVMEATRGYNYCRPVVIDHFQSNHEGALIDRIHQAVGAYDFLVVNAGALTHYSIALRDALLAAGLPFAEVHISNVFAREPFRHASVLSDIAFTVISGGGELAYALGVTAGLEYLARGEAKKAQRIKKQDNEGR